MSIKRKYISIDAQSKESLQEVRLMNKENIICGRQMMLKNPDTQELEDIRDIFMHKDGIIYEIAEIVKQMIGQDLSGIEKIDLDSEYTLADVAAKVNEILGALKGSDGSDDEGGEGDDDPEHEPEPEPDVDPEITRVVYTEESGLPACDVNIVGILEDVLIPNRESIKEIYIGNTVEEIYNDAFSGCSGLTTVTIPDSVTSISGYAFSNCSSLTTITIPSSVVTFSPAAFEGSRFTSMTFEGKTMAEVKEIQMALQPGTNIICSDGSFVVE